MDKLQKVKEALEAIVNRPKEFGTTRFIAKEALAELNAYTERLTSDELVEEVAVAIRDMGCGYTVDGQRVFCDNPGVEREGLQDICECKTEAKVAINIIKEKT